PFFNVLAAFWIQFMTHDWFSHLDEARNDPTRTVSLGCASERVDNVVLPISPERAAQLGCRQDDRMDVALIAQGTDPATFIYKTAAKSEKRLPRAYKTTETTNPAWWAASQLYGYADRSRRRMRRDPADSAKLAMTQVEGRAATGDRYGYLPAF